MYNWQIEHMAEYDRHRILEEAQKIQLENIALLAPAYRPGLFSRTMFNLANWMISTGGELRKRYEAPAVPCSNCPTGSLAR